MRYINKEYGFAFRPPYFDKFYEEKKDGPPLTEANFPGKYILGAGYDYNAINGAVLIGKYGSMWGIKVSYLSGSKWLDSDTFIHKMNASSANTVDGSFAHFSSGPLSAKWVRHNDQSMLLQLSARRKLRVRIIFYPCHGLSGELSIEGGTVKGRCPHLGILPGTVSIGETGAVYEGRTLVICDSDPAAREFFYAHSYNKPSDSANGAFNEAIMEFFLGKNQPTVYLYASVGDESIFSTEIPRKDKVIKQIETAELRYGVNKTMGTGILGAPAERMLNSVLWSRVYYPYLMTEIYSPTRTLLNKHFDIRGTEENCSAILGGLVEAERAANQLKYTTEDKILALLALWNVYAHKDIKTGLLPLTRQLFKLYPPHAELYVSEADDKSVVAYKWTDSPLKETKASPMFSLDLSCLRLLAFDILERICVMFDLPERGKYETAKKEMIALINEVFWDESRGAYTNCYTTGERAKRIGATSFYPLIAGAVNDPDRLTRLLIVLTDHKKFWGGFPVPTLSASDPEYGKRGKPDNNGKRPPPFLEYRGSVVPYVNYLIYQGLSRYGLDELAGSLAAKSAELWAANERGNVENYSMYLPGGKRYKAREYFSSNGNMLAMIGMQELIDLEYFRPDLKTQSIRFGTFVAGNHSLTNCKLRSRSYSVDVRDESTVLLCDGVPVFRGDGGRFVVRNYLETHNGVEFMIDAHANITVNLSVQAAGQKQPVRYFLIVPPGKSMVSAENGSVSVRRVGKR